MLMIRVRHARPSPFVAVGTTVDSASAAMLQPRFTRLRSWTTSSPIPRLSKTAAAPHRRLVQPLALFFKLPAVPTTPSCAPQRVSSGGDYMRMDNWDWADLPAPQRQRRRRARQPAATATRGMRKRKRSCLLPSTVPHTSLLRSLSREEEEEGEEVTSSTSQRRGVRPPRMLGRDRVGLKSSRCTAVPITPSCAPATRFT